MPDHESTNGPEDFPTVTTDVPPARSRRRATKKAAAGAEASLPAAAAEPAKKATKRTRAVADRASASALESASLESALPEPVLKAASRAAKQVTPVPPAVAFIAPQADLFAAPVPAAQVSATPPPARPQDADADQPIDGERPARRRGRRGRGRGKGSGEVAGDVATEPANANTDANTDELANADTRSTGEEEQETTGDGISGPRRRRRRRRTTGESSGEDSGGGLSPDDPPNTVVKVRKTRPRGRDTDDEVQGVKGSVRLEAKRQRRREGRDQGRKRPAIITEAEFLARREAVDRTMVVRQVSDRTQVAVLEDGVLVEHYVTRASATAYAGNIYLGKVQNVLPSMEAAFVDIGKSRNAVLYAGEVNWDASGMEGKARKIEDALKAGQSVLCQVTKDPVGHKGARLTSQISLPGRFLVYVPEGSMTGISRKLPENERKRLKDILKKIVPDDAGVIIRTAAEGASEEELTRDVKRLQAQWEAIQAKVAKRAAPVLLYGEPDLVIRVVRDIFNEDFTSLVVSGDQAWELVEEYVKHVSPDLVDRLSRHTADTDAFADLRVDEQLAKALDRKVWLPSGGSLVIDRTEAMTVVDVNTGKFTGQGGNLEETVTRNNLEAAEELVRQLRLRDIGGMIVVDFIDMILEANRDLVLRRLTECLSRDRTRHQVAEVTSLGLVQMTRKRVGQGLLEVFSEPCETCNGRGLIVHMEPVEHSTASEQRHQVSEPKASTRRGGGSDRQRQGVMPDGLGRNADLPELAESPPTGALPEPVAVVVPPDGALPEPVVASPTPRGRRKAASRPAGPPGELAKPEPMPAPGSASDIALTR